MLEKIDFFDKVTQAVLPIQYVTVLRLFLTSCLRVGFLKQDWLQSVKGLYIFLMIYIFYN